MRIINLAFIKNEESKLHLFENQILYGRQTHKSKGSWKKQKNGISQTADKVLGKRMLVPKKSWTTNILTSVEEKNRFKILKINRKSKIGYKIAKNQL